ncbi:FAD-dependent monooxygenase [Massilia sp. BJB1822]|uniref:FAD-dependent monooxygenase n=1 Tax=Massilia sp. BJB1822 TaxID=2744470 RepID=UPI001593BF26|nr:FAD-dependent monooxygenase [Massilia sp. BJB1822]NVE01259.1 FAD-dependent monooxygenase [Massilia sp. BJB1822]
MNGVSSILVVGAGPVGMCAAIQAARRGIDVIVVEAKAEDAVADAKCNSVASRTLETLRRFGIAEQVRAVGLPDDYPTDVIYTTSITGPEMTRIPMPSRDERRQTPFPAGSPDEGWRSAEPYVRVSQRYSNQVLARLMHATPGITVLYNTEVLGHEQLADEVKVQIRGADGSQSELRARYVIAADGGRSPVRHQLGIKLSGDAELGHMRSSLIHAPGLLALFNGRRPAWMSWVVNHHVKGVVVAIDGKDQWLVHRALPSGVRDFAALDADQSIRDVLGVDADFKYEVLQHEDWIGRRLVADRMRDRRVFLAGDAAHLWVPFAGYGMNAGIADGVSIAWLLSNVLQGWADPAMLDAYEAERQPITEQVSRYAMQSMMDTMEALGRNTPPASLSSRYNPAGLAIRRVMGGRLHKLNVPQFAPAGLNFGYYYDKSPLISYDGTSPPEYDMGSVTHSTVPGCRLPHFWIGPGVSVYDKLGPVYTLLRFDRTLDIEPLVAASAAAGMPLAVLDLPPRDNDAPFTHPLLVVREDQHVVWRGDVVPQDPGALVHLLCGRRVEGGLK